MTSCYLLNKTKLFTLKFRKYTFLFFFFVAAFVPTELFHYVHVISDVSEHYEHHKESSFLDFISHALIVSSECTSDHPDHHHSPFHHHHTTCSVSFLSILPSKIIPMVEYFQVMRSNKVFITTSSPSITEVSFSIWQPPKLV